MDRLLDAVADHLGNPANDRPTVTALSCIAAGALVLLYAAHRLTNGA